MLRAHGVEWLFASPLGGYCPLAADDDEQGDNDDEEKEEVWSRSAAVDALLNEAHVMQVMTDDE